MSSSPLTKSTSIDRDDYDADHYADWMRDRHRSRLTLDQLDIARRQLKTKEKFLSHILDLKLKEHTRVKNGFIRKIEQDVRISNLPNVQQTLKIQKRTRLQSSLSRTSIEHSSEINKSEQKLHQLTKNPKSIPRITSPKTERLEANIKKFNHLDTILN